MFVLETLRDLVLQLRVAWSFVNPFLGIHVFNYIVLCMLQAFHLLSCAHLPNVTQLIDRRHGRPFNPIPWVYYRK